MASYDAKNFWSLVNIMESEVKRLIEPLQTEFQNLQPKLFFLIVILDFKGKSHIQEDTLQAPLDRAFSVYDNVVKEYIRFWSDFYQTEAVGDGNMDARLSRMLQGLELLVPDVQEIYAILSKSSSASTGEMPTDELVMKQLNSILKNMEDLLRCKADCVAPIREEVEGVQKGLTFLRDFLGFTAKRCSELRKLKDFMVLAEAVADNISCLLYLCLVKSEMDDQMLCQMKLELSKQLQKLNPDDPDVREIYIRALKALGTEGNPTPLDDEFALGFLKSLQDSLLELSPSDNNRLSFMTSFRDVMLELHQELSSLKDYAMGSPWKKYSTKVNEKFKALWRKSDALIKQAGCVIYSLYDYEENESMAKELIAAVSAFLADIKFAKENARNIYNQVVPRSLRSNFPRTDKLGSISFIFHNLRAVLVSQPDSVAPLKYQIEAVLEDLELLLKDFRGIIEQHKELEDQLVRFKDIVYHTECVVDLLVTEGRPCRDIKLGLFDINEDIKKIKLDIKHIKNKKRDEASLFSVPSMSVEVSLVADSSKQDETLGSNDTTDEKKPNSELMITEQEAEKIRDQIANGSEKLELLSIVGMPGVGKTTLADSLFQQFSRTNCFHVLARCSVTQSYKSKRLFLEILKQIDDDKDLNDLGEADLAEKLYRKVKGRKYLIFMDDVWNSEPFEIMNPCLPDDMTGSRILITSRFDNIASQANWMSTTYRLSPLSDEKAWKLLQVKVFGSESCPQKLVEVGKKLATICGGLPLLVDVIAGLLRAVETNTDGWLQMAENLKAEPVDDPQGRCRNTIELSYSNLPDHLKACFLYFAAFPKGQVISTWKLISLWIAEGFVQQVLKDDERSLEVAAKTYLDDLIGRNLVTITERGTLGKVKSSRVHDLLHDFALEKAKEESFLKRVQDYDEDLPTLSSDGYIRSEGYRLCFYADKAGYIMVRGPRARTVICIDLPFSVPSLCSNFKLLRVLDLTRDYSPSSHAINTLIHLRFLALRRLELKHLEGFNKLTKLEILFVEKPDEGNLLLEYIWGLEKLRHFHLKKSFVLKYQSKQVLHKFQLENLLSFSHPKLCYGELSEKVMKRMPNLQKLSCGFLDYWDSTTNCNLFPKLELLGKLESLSVTYMGNRPDASYPCKFSFPPYLKKVALENFGLPWSEISLLGELQHLEVLKLGRLTFKGETWEMRGGQFPKLKFLSFSHLDIEEWIASEEDHLPCLEKLHVIGCKKLEELPSCFAEKATLKEIYLSGCKPSIASSAEQIKEGQEDIGNEQFVLKITY